MCVCGTQVERFAFYERGKQAFAVVATGWVLTEHVWTCAPNSIDGHTRLCVLDVTTHRETALYGNLILKKGVIGTSQ